MQDKPKQSRTQSRKQSRKQFHNPLADRRAQYAKRRLSKMRTVCPDLSDEALATTDLRTLSFAVRRMRAGRQTLLKHAHDPAPPVDSAGIKCPREQLAHTEGNEVQHDSRMSCKCVETAQIVMGRYQNRPCCVP